MAQGKGKGLARRPDETSPQMAEESFIERVGSSATGLWRSTILEASAAQMTSSLASSSFTSEKSQSSSSHAESAYTNVTESPDSGYRLQRSSGSSLSNSSSESFRSTPYEFGGVNSKTEAEFGTFSQTSQVERTELETPAEIKENPCNESAHQDISEYSASQSAGPGSCFGPTNEWNLVNTDGELVVALLSDPNSDLEETVSAVALSDELSDPTILFEIPPGTEGALNRIKSDLPSPPTYKTPSPMNPLNLIPDFRSDHETPLRDDTKPIPTTMSHIYIMANKPIGIQELEPWLDVLTNYQDEVWGDVASLVREVRDEVRIAKENNIKAIDSTTVRRLGMILGHLKMPVTSVSQTL